MQSGEHPKESAKLALIKQMITTIRWVLAAVLFFTGYLIFTIMGISLPDWSAKSEKEAPKGTLMTENILDDGYWHAPEESSLAGNPKQESILYGKDLIVNTSKYFGPKGIVKMNATNGLNCQNCHLDAGTKVFGNNYGSVASTYPRYRARSGMEEDVFKRVNDCFERSLDGEALAVDSREMLAIVDYINWVGKDVPKGQKAEGSGLKELAFLDRAADPSKGKIAYAEKCQSCHQADGLGTLNFDQTGYSFPPLWGPNSYNDGAGLYRISNFAKYIMSNMPQGVSHDNPQLSVEEAWDIAAYVNSQPRPKKDISKDWPKIEEKPIDHPFGPFADGFSEQQHKYGPFPPIQEKRAQMKALSQK
jgi:thiosulfate dehydrogenase